MTCSLLVSRVAVNSFLFIKNNFTEAFAVLPHGFR